MGPFSFNRMGNPLCVLLKPIFPSHMCSCALCLFWLPCKLLCHSVTRCEAKIKGFFVVVLLMECLDNVNLLLPRYCKYCSDRKDNLSERVGRKGDDHYCIMALLSAKWAAPASAVPQNQVCIFCRFWALQCC